MNLYLDCYDFALKIFIRAQYRPFAGQILKVNERTPLWNFAYHSKLEKSTGWRSTRNLRQNSFLIGQFVP